MSQAGSNSSSGSGGSGIQTIDGDVGSVTGSTVTLTGGSSGAIFTGAGTVMTESFNFLAMNSAASISTISIDGMIVYNAGLNAATVSDNTFVGASAGTNLSATYIGNTSIGTDSLQIFAGTGNTSAGYQSLLNINTTTDDPSNNNTTFGVSTGNNYTGSESNNILIGPNVLGVLGESNVIRIGNQGSGDSQQNKCFIAGIVGNTVANAQSVTINSSTGQLGIGPGTPESADIDVSDDFWNFPVSQLPWVVVGNGTWTFPASTAAHSGIISSPSIANIVSDTATGMYLGNITSAQSTVLGGGQIQINWIFNIVTLSNGTNRYGINVGFGDSQGGLGQSNGVYFSYSDNVNSGDWQIVTSAASTKTTTSTAVAVTTGWHNAQVLVNAAATSAVFTMDGTVLGTITTNIPSLPMSPFWGASWVSGTIASGTFLVDEFQMNQILTTPR
jgi:hypothetical protein